MGRARRQCGQARCRSSCRSSFCASAKQVPDFTLCAALLKKDRFDLVLEKATELGVRRIQPIITRRCVADKLNTRTRADDHHRSCRTMRAHRAARTGRTGEARHIAHELEPNAARCSSPTSKAVSPLHRPSRRKRQPAALLIGPEGGFDEAERAAIRALRRRAQSPSARASCAARPPPSPAVRVWMATAGDW